MEGIHWPPLMADLDAEERGSSLRITAIVGELENAVFVEQTGMRLKQYVDSIKFLFEFDQIVARKEEDLIKIKIEISERRSFSISLDGDALLYINHWGGECLSLSPIKRSVNATNAMDHLGDDVLFKIFPLLDFFDIVRCSAVCKSWNLIFSKSKSLEVFCYKQQQLNSTSSSKTTSCSEKPLKEYFKELAFEQHRLALKEGRVHIDQWNGHLSRIDQCRMKRGLILTGVGDKVMRIWSVENYNCMEEYSIPGETPLVDFDFDESKIVGLAGKHIFIWRRNSLKNIICSQDGTFMKGLCMRYFDPEAIVGCEDGTARVFDMYSRKCSRILRMQAAPVTCLCLTDNQLILSGSGSSFGSVRVSDCQSDQRVTELRSNNSGGLKTLCYNPSTNLVFGGSTSGYVNCWDLRMMKSLWEKRVSPNVIYSMQHCPDDSSSLVVGGIDGILRVLNQNSGELVSSCVTEANVSSSSRNVFGAINRKEGRRISGDAHIDRIPTSLRLQITCLAVGMKKVVTTHNGLCISVWKFKN